MKQRYLFLVLCFLAIIVFSLYVSAATPLPFELTNSDFTPERVPLSYDKYGFLPVIEIKVAGKSIRLGLDTGADWMTVSIKREVLKTLAVTDLGSSRTSVSQGKMFRGKNFLIPEASLGGLQLRNLAGTEERDYDSVDGLLGNQFLKQFLVLIDYPGGAMVLYPKDHYPVELGLADWTKLPFQYRKNLGIVIPGKLGPKGKSLQFILDTGCTVSNQGKTMGIIRPKYVAKSDMAEAIAIPQLGEHPYTQTEHFYLSDRDMGPMQFLVYDFQQPPVDGFIGHHFFVKYRVLIDFDNQVLFFSDK